MDDDLEPRSFSHVRSHHGPVKEELHERHVPTLPAPRSSSPNHYTSTLSREPPPPPPAAYASPPNEEDDHRQDSAVSPLHSRPDFRQDPDPIPPPPAKYSYPLPSISEALERFEARRPGPPEYEPAISPRTETNGSAARGAYDLEAPGAPGAPGAPMRSLGPGYGAPTTSAPAYSQAMPTHALTVDCSQYPRKSSVEEHKITPRSSVTPSAASHYEPYKPSYTRPADGHYRPPYHPPAPYPGRTLSQDAMPPPQSAPSNNVYTPALYPPQTQPAHSPPASSWQPSPYRNSDGKRPIKATYGESVKRHLDGFDLDQSLNGIADSSKELLDFSVVYRQKAHQTHRSGPVPGSTPQIQEVDEMMRHGTHIQDSLNRLREVIVTQEAEMQERSERAAKVVSEEPPARHEKSIGGFAGSDPKKRRGRAAPPGKCHSCNRIDTPEWRRGPDGARTLCNACGLHYAKLTRKSGTSKAAPSGSSLRPKDTSPV